MKTLTKEDLPIGTKVVPHNKTVTGASRIDECDHWNSEKAQKQGFLYVSGYTTDGALKLNEYPNRNHGNFYNYSDVTLYEEKPKIKKSELLNRIEVLENKVADLEEKSKVTIVHPPTWATEPGTVIGKGTIEGEEDKPQFEVGKVYKGIHKFIYNVMIYVTEIKEDTMYGIGFDGAGDWIENDYWEMTDQFTEATPEEWFNRLEEEAKKRYPKGTKMKCLKGWSDDGYSEWYDNTPKFKYDNHNVILWAMSINFYDICVMRNGKWAEIIEEPQYQVGTLGAFWDGDFDECLEKGTVLFGKLDHITENGHFRPKGKSWSWDNFKPIKID